MSTALERVARERARQIDELGYSPAWDDANNGGDELAVAAACYLTHDTARMVIDCGHTGSAHAVDAWPWPAGDKRTLHDRLGRLVIAAALALAAVEQELRRLGGGQRADEDHRQANGQADTVGALRGLDTCHHCRRHVTDCVCVRAELVAGPETSTTDTGRV